MLKFLSYASQAKVLKLKISQGFAPAAGPLAVAGFLVVALLALAIFWSAWLLAGSLDFCLVLGFRITRFLSKYVLAPWFLHVSFYVMCSAFVAASPQPLTLVHCFKTLGPDRYGGLLGRWVWLFGFCVAKFLY